MLLTELKIRRIIRLVLYEQFQKQKIVPQKVKSLPFKEPDPPDPDLVALLSNVSDEKECKNYFDRENVLEKIKKLRQDSKRDIDYIVALGEYLEELFNEFTEAADESIVVDSDYLINKFNYLLKLIKNEEAMVARVGESDVDPEKFKRWSAKRLQELNHQRQLAQIRKTHLSQRTTQLLKSRQQLMQHDFKMGVMRAYTEPGSLSDKDPTPEEVIAHYGKVRDKLMATTCTGYEKEMVKKEYEKYVRHVENMAKHKDMGYRILFDNDEKREKRELRSAFDTEEKKIEQERYEIQQKIVDLYGKQKEYEERVASFERDEDNRFVDQESGRKLASEYNEYIKNRFDLNLDLAAINRKHRELINKFKSDLSSIENKYRV